MLSDKPTAAVDQYAVADRANKIPAVLRRRFPFGRLLPLAPFVNVCAGGTAFARLYPVRGAEVLRAFALRFSGKRLRAVDVHRIEVRAIVRGEHLTLWRADAALARMLELYRDAGRPARRYAFVDLTCPGSGVGGLDLAHDVYVELDIGPAAVNPCVNFWGVLL